MIGVDGKTLRGSAAAGQPGRHLLAALDHGHGVVLGQVGVEAKTNEIPMFAALLDRIDLAGAVVTVMASLRNLAITILRLTGKPALPPPCATTRAGPAGHGKRS